MITKLISSHIILEKKIVSGAVYFDENKIIKVALNNEEYPYDNLLDYGDNYVSSGFIDIHTHGAKGFDFSSCSLEEAKKAIDFMTSHGLTSVMPTITSSTYENIYNSLEMIEQLMNDKEYGKYVIGAHLEGPYLSLNQCGAQNKNLITEPIYKHYSHLIRRFKKVIKRWDYAPERDIDCQFCEYLNKHHILPSIGHSDAKYNDVTLAMSNGAKLITHFYSCTSTITRDHGYRILGINECGYLFDDLYIELIADGKHLPIELLKMIFKIKDHRHIILVTDSLKVTGTDDIYSSVGDVPCIIDDGVAKLLDKSAFAGSIATVDVLLKTAIQTGLNIIDASNMLSVNVSKLFKLKVGQIKKNYEPSFTILDKDFSVIKVVKKGVEL